LFSAPFGTGKSMFLKNYFDDQDDLIVLKLFPVNYSISQNEDVFELIKYDLLYELLSKYPDEIAFDKEQYSLLLISQMFLLHQMKIDLPIKLILKAASVVTGTPITDGESIGEIVKTITEFSEFKTKINSTEATQLSKYIKSFKGKTGHVHESDEITERLINMLERIVASKNENGEKKITTVLLIDDLDRLDPEHVFRLFNVFSAHYDELTETNKFGFDKIVFVCDVNNIQQMFSHKYGISVEFNGYIDKFYSSEIFKFDITKYLKESLKTLLESRYDLRKYFVEESSLDKSFVDRYRLDKYDGFYEILQYIVNGLIDLNQIRIRNFQRFSGFALPNKSFKHRDRELHVVFYPLLVLLINLERFFGRPIELERAFELLYQNYSSNYDVRVSNKRWEEDNTGSIIIQLSLPFIVDSRLVFDRDFERDKEYTTPFKNENGDNINVVFKISESFRASFAQVDYLKCTLTDTISNGVSDNPPILRPNPFWFIYCAYKNIRSNRYL
jgi:hypothetical protein